MKSHTTIKRIISLSLLYLIIVLILVVSWYSSSQNGAISGSYSMKPAKEIARILYGYGELAITQKINMVAWIEAFNWMIRKFTHFAEYGFIGLLLCITFNITLRKNWLAATLAFMICTGWAVLDEYHQSFVAGRYARWFDVVIDVSGALIAIVLVTLFFYLSNRIKKLKQQNTELMTLGRTNISSKK